MRERRRERRKERRREGKREGKREGGREGGRERGRQIERGEGGEEAGEGGKGAGEGGKGQELRAPRRWLRRRAGAGKVAVVGPRPKGPAGWFGLAGWASVRE